MTMETEGDEFVRKYLEQEKKEIIRKYHEQQKKEYEGEPQHYFAFRGATSPAQAQEFPHAVKNCGADIQWWERAIFVFAQQKADDPRLGEYIIKMSPGPYPPFPDAESIWVPISFMQELQVSHIVDAEADQEYWVAQGNKLIHISPPEFVPIYIPSMNIDLRTATAPKGTQ